VETSNEHQCGQFEEEEEIEPLGVNPILIDILRDAQDPRSNGIRYREEIAWWAFEMLRMCGTKALNIARRAFPQPSRQTLSGFFFVLDRVRP
jgi:hypothetical protein